MSAVAGGRGNPKAEDGFDKLQECDSDWGERVKWYDIFADVILEPLLNLKTERCHSFIAVRNFVTILRQKPRRFFSFRPSHRPRSNIDTLAQCTVGLL